MSNSFDLEIRDEIYNHFKEAEIYDHDVVLIHSDISKNLIRYKKRDPNFKLNTFVNIIIDYFKKGTVIFPTFNFHFCEKGSYDYLKTPSKMGILSEQIRKGNLHSRTLHPVYSFVALGSNSKLFQECQNIEAFSEDSPFGILRNLKGKIAIWNLPDQKSMTYYHFIERENKVRYRFDKIFFGNYTNKDKKTSKKKYTVFVRDVKKNVITDVQGMEEILWKYNLYKGNRFNIGSGLRSIKIEDLFDKVSEIIQKNLALGNLYKIK